MVRIATYHDASHGESNYESFSLSLLLSLFHLECTWGATFESSRASDSCSTLVLLELSTAE